MKKLIALMLSLFILAGCATEPETDEVPSGIQDGQEVQNPAPEASEIPYEETCDTLEVQPLTIVKSYRMGTYVPTCPTDRTQTSAVLPALDLATNSLEPCKLEEDNDDRRRWWDGAMTVGFPRSHDRMADGEYSVMVVPIEWPDLKDGSDPSTFIPYAIEKFRDWYSTYSRGKVELEISFHPNWVELSDESSEFSQSEYEQNAEQHGDSNQAKVANWWNKALAAADPFVDFSGVDIVMFVQPREQDIFEEFNLWPPGTGTYFTDEGPISRGFTPGSFPFRPENELWFFWVHETLHYFGMPDLYWTDLNSFRAQALVMPAPNYGYDVMTFNLVSRLNSWLLWLLGWAEDEEMACLDPSKPLSGSIEIAANHISDSRKKGVMIPISEHELVLIESHRETAFDFPSTRSMDGVLIHLLDTRIPHGDGAMTVLAPEGRTLIHLSQEGGNQTQVLDAIFYEGNSIRINGVEIRVSQSLDDSDLVSIETIPNWSTPEKPNYVCISRENRDRSLDDDPLSCPLNF
ncbi:MAG: hypothetical protein VWZ99_03850 [Aquiluna sp.]